MGKGKGKRKTAGASIGIGITELENLDKAKAIYKAGRNNQGRDVKLDAALISKFSLLIRLGLSIRRCADFCGISYSTVDNWFTRAERGEALFKHFAIAIKQAESELQLAILSDIKGMVQKRDSWEGYFRYLESRFPKEFLKLPDDRDRDTEAVKVIKALTDLLRARPERVTVTDSVTSGGVAGAVVSERSPERATFKSLPSPSDSEANVEVD